MSKKVISVLLSVAIVAAMLCVGIGMITASADTVTYYFLAPDSYLTTNDSVGVYFWQPSEIAPWPGAAMQRVESLGKNVYAASVPDKDDTGTIIFNAFVDAGNPADPALAAVAHQTININVEGYDKGESKIYDQLDNFYGMIYVLANDADHQSVNDYSGAVTTSGEWFSVNPSDDNYYRNYDAYYGTYGFTDDYAPTSDADSEVHEGDTVKVSLTLGSVDNAGTLTSYINFDSSVLKYTGEKTTANIDATILVNDSFDVAEGLTDTIVVGAVFDAEGNEHTFAGEAANVATLSFTALKDMSLDDVKKAVSEKATEITKIANNDVVDVVINYELSDGVYDPYSGLAFEVICPHSTDTETPVTSDTDTASDTDTTGTSDTDSASDTDTTGASDTDTSTVTDTDTSATSSQNNSSKNDSSNASSNTSSKDTNDNASKSSSSKSSTTSGSIASNGAAVQTAGTFAIVSLVVILMAAAAVVLYTRKKTEE